MTIGGVDYTTHVLCFLRSLSVDHPVQPGTYVAFVIDTVLAFGCHVIAATPSFVTGQILHAFGDGRWRAANVHTTNHVHVVDLKSGDVMHEGDYLVANSSTRVWLHEPGPGATLFSDDRGTFVRR